MMDLASIDVPSRYHVDIAGLIACGADKSFTSLWRFKSTLKVFIHLKTPFRPA